MEPFKMNIMDREYRCSAEVIKLLGDALEAYGEYKGYLKNMSYDYNNFLDTLFVNETYYSFKIDNMSIKKEDMFFMPYKTKSNVTTEFMNMRKALIVGLTESSKFGFDVLLFNKLNRILYSNCKKDNTTRGSGMLRKKQTYLLKPGLAGSSVSYIPPKHTDLILLINDLGKYLNDDKERNFVTIARCHYQFEKMHPYMAGNGLIGRLLVSIQTSCFKK